MSCHQVFLSARLSTEENSRHSDRNISLFPSPVRAKDLSAPLYFLIDKGDIETRAVIKVFFPARLGAEENSCHSDRNNSLFPSCSG